MGIEDEQSLELEEKLGKFAEEVSDAGEFVKDCGDAMFLQDLLSYGELEGNEAEMIAALTEHFGIDLSNPQVVKVYSIQGTPGTSGEGEIKVRVIATNDPQIFLGEYTYTDGDTAWAIRPLEVEE